MTQTSVAKTNTDGVENIQSVEEEDKLEEKKKEEEESSVTKE